MSPFIASIDLTALGGFFGGLGVLLTALTTITILAFKRVIKTAQEVETRIDGLIASHLESQLANRDPSRYYTLDITFKNGTTLVVPMIPLVEVTFAKNLHAFVADHNEQETTIQIRSTGFAALPPHSHAHSCETIEIRRGSVTHLETGHVYIAGDIWSIGIGEVHSAVFSGNFLGLITHRPKLPTAKTRPVDLAGLRDDNHVNN
jgi:quercetin dioxygenase-like cupin family protein|tara:strand:- start:2347 stop:2958 length:612 start_codon:yes stop_codon:yes gene_type:complete